MGQIEVDPELLAPALGVRQKETALPARWCGLCGLHLGLALLGQSVLGAFPVDSLLTALVVGDSPDLLRGRQRAGAPRRARHVLAADRNSAPTHKAKAMMRTPLLGAASKPAVPLRDLLDYKFELLSTIHTGIVAVAEWYNFQIPTGHGP